MTLYEIANKIYREKYATWKFGVATEDIYSRQVKAALEAVEGELNAIRTEINILKARKDG